MKNLKLTQIKTTSPKDAEKKKSRKDLLKLHKDIYALQHLFYASHSKSLLIVFQGMDTAGKDGVIRNVFNCINPLGVHATSFKAPCDMEREHDYMWRIFQKLPEKGMIQIFNRSHYEDILVPTIQKSLSKNKIDKRYLFINAFEEHLIENDTDIIKFFLHISPEEQIERIQKRLKNPLKKWKYSDEDLKSSKKWNDYMEVYESILNRCNKIPWTIVPSDDKWHRDFVVASIIKEKLESMLLSFPMQNTITKKDKSVAIDNKKN